MANSLDEFFRLMREAEGCEVQTIARLDFHREGRNGVPEVIMAEGKQPDDTVRIVGAFLEAKGRALVSRVGESLLARLSAEFPDHEFDMFSASRMVVVRRPGLKRPTTGGKIGVLTAGTSDVPVAEEARVIAEEMGCEVLTAFDVGVAGIHRLFQPLRAMLEAPVDAIVVAAGMDGALPSVVAGLVDVPVIGLPTSVGYGLGGKGVAALMGMLQSCSPGLTVVNIDNGIGAGATAALIANRMAALRQKAKAAEGAKP
ncbi:MAG: nickel pincer cofactor biosynthesis protein LarB [Bacteroidetes bacterium]|nr:nickel pincer cofactor biosynthesis protein LarB [Bacteroidota bacterium]MCL5026042.1 nickel pincer cofactor biosynthesis protein LarB [Chloroflexota bacterium]